MTDSSEIWNFPWGDTDLNLCPPHALHFGADCIWPDCAGAMPGQAEYRQKLAEALQFPLGQSRLETRVGPGSKVAIVVDDPSRWSPLAWAVPLVLEELARAGVEAENISIAFGVGRHATVSRDDMARRLGQAIVEKYNCYSPPVDDLSAYEELGVSSDGVVVRVFRPVARADLRILIGSVLPHLQAGFGGGWKLIFPGCSHRSTLGQIHQQGLDGHAQRLLGSEPVLNPMRKAISRAARLLPGGTLSVSHVIGRNSQEIFNVLAGEPDDVEMQLAQEAKRRFEYRPAEGQPLADMIIVGNAPWPGDPMHSFKVLLNHRAACKPGGILAGVFWTDPAELGRSFPLGPARMIARSGKIGALATRFGLPLAEKVAAWRGSPKRFMMRWARELVLDRQVLVYSPEMRQIFGPRLGSVRLTGDAHEFWQIAQSHSRPISNVRLFPYGGLTYAPQLH